MHISDATKHLYVLRKRTQKQPTAQRGDHARPISPAPEHGNIIEFTLKWANY